MAMPTNKNKQISKVQTLPQRYILYLYIVNNLQDSSQKNSFFFSFLKTLQKISRILDNFSLLPPLIVFSPLINQSFLCHHLPTSCYLISSFCKGMMKTRRTSRPTRSWPESSLGAVARFLVASFPCYY